MTPCSCSWGGFFSLWLEAHFPFCGGVSGPRRSSGCLAGRRRVNSTLLLRCCGSVTVKAKRRENLPSRAEQLRHGEFSRPGDSCWCERVTRTSPHLASPSISSLTGAPHKRLPQSQELRRPAVMPVTSFSRFVPETTSIKFNLSSQYSVSSLLVSKTTYSVVIQTKSRVAVLVASLPYDARLFSHTFFFFTLVPHSFLFLTPLS